MTEYSVAPEDIEISVLSNSLSTYEFGSKIAKHHFCNKCGIYTFHQTMIKLGYYRINIGCISGINSTELPFKVHNGALL